MEPYKKQITVETHRRDEPNERGLRFFVVWDSIGPHGDANHAAFSLTKTTDTDDIQRMFDAY
jgi:hypothetical protein